MDLKEYLAIIKKQQKTFGFVIFLVVAIILIYFLFRPVSYSTSLTINITRLGQQRTYYYQYDDFYRLQADEKFAETLVEWLKSPRTVSDIYSEAGLNLQAMSSRKLSKIFRAQKLSPQLVAISYGSTNEEIAKNISSAISKKLTENTNSLNQDQKEDTWFKIIAHDPVIVRDDFNWIFVLGVALILGIFLAFWTVLIIHYLK